MCSMSCLYCRKLIREDSSITCSVCDQSIHYHCAIDDNPSTDGWYCRQCIGSALPFNHITNDDNFLHEMSQFFCNQKISFEDLQNLNINPFDLNELQLGNNTNVNANYEINNYNEKCKYHCSDTFNELNNIIDDDKLSLIHFNSRSLSKNLESITDYLKTLNHKFPIIAFSETWLKDDSILPSLNSIEGYELAHCNRMSQKRGGGAALFISNDLNYKVRHDLNLKNSVDYETVFIEIESKPKNTIIGVIYRPPDRCPKPFITNLASTLNLINQENLPCFLCGDFNINLLNITSHQDSNEFLNTLYSAHFYPLIDKPTRVTTRTASLIDNIFSNVLNSKITPGILYNDITDHFPVFHLINKDKNANKSANDKATFYWKRNITKDNLASFKSALKGANWKDVFTNSSADQSYDIFINMFTSLYNKHFPKVKKKNQ